MFARRVFQDCIHGCEEGAPAPGAKRKKGGLGISDYELDQDSTNQEIRKRKINRSFTDSLNRK